jgi:rubredoxin
MARRGACAASRWREAPIEWRFPGSDSRRADFRSAVERYAG